jgi:hypothetical protein
MTALNWQAFSQPLDITMRLSLNDLLSVRMALSAAGSEWNGRARIARADGNAANADTCGRIADDYHRLWNVFAVAGGDAPVEA